MATYDECAAQLRKDGFNHVDGNRSKRVAWSDMPAPTQKAIVAYLES